MRDLPQGTRDPSYGRYDERSHRCRTNLGVNSGRNDSDLVKDTGKELEDMTQGLGAEQ